MQIYRAMARVTDVLVCKLHESGQELLIGVLQRNDVDIRSSFPVITRPHEMILRYSEHKSNVRERIGNRAVLIPADLLWWQVLCMPTSVPSRCHHARGRRANGHSPRGEDDCEHVCYEGLR